MDFLVFMIIFFFTLTFVKFFNKKLISLLTLEGLMLSTIILCQSFFLFSSSSVFLLMTFSIFMVLDSVFGISLLISSSRSSTLNNKLMI